MLRTIELMLGLPNLTLFDLVANDLRVSFTETADLAPYTAVEPTQPIDAFNKPVAALRGAERDGALASARMNFHELDAAPADTLNRIQWHAARGWDVPYPETRRGPFAPAPTTVAQATREDRD